MFIPCVRALRLHELALSGSLLLLIGSPAIVGAQVPVRSTRSADAPTRGIDMDELMMSVETLASPDFEGRRTGTPGGLKARAWLVERFKEIGVAPFDNAYVLPFTLNTRTGETAQGGNVAAVCPGTAGLDKVIVISAHYDHLGIRNGQLHPGADDNASGVTVLLALARTCQQTPFRHTLVFVAFDAEEQGLRGARAFVAAPPLPRQRIALNLNLDMVSRGDKGELYAAGTRHYPQLRRLLEPVAARASVTLLFGHDAPGTGREDWTNQSDHGVFHEVGIPFVYFGVEDHADYHQPSDTANKVHAGFFGRVAYTILDALTTLDHAAL